MGPVGILILKRKRERDCRGAEADRRGEGQERDHAWTTITTGMAWANAVGCIPRSSPARLLPSTLNRRTTHDVSTTGGGTTRAAQIRGFPARKGRKPGFDPGGGSILGIEGGEVAEGETAVLVVLAHDDEQAVGDCLRLLAPPREQGRGPGLGQIVIG